MERDMYMYGKRPIQEGNSLSHARKDIDHVVRCDTSVQRDLCTSKRDLYTYETGPVYI